MKREGFWRYATPPVSFFGIPLPFLLIYLTLFPFPGMNTFYICTGILATFLALYFFDWSLRKIWARLVSTFRGKVASGRPWWYRHFIETPRDWTGF